MIALSGLYSGPSCENFVEGVSVLVSHWRNFPMPYSFRRVRQTSWRGCGMVVRMKTCTKCGETKALEEFPPRKRSKDGRDGWCRACHRAAATARRLTPEGLAKSRKQTTD